MFTSSDRKKQTLSLIISTLFIFQPIIVAAGGVKVDTTRSGNTFTDTSRSGVPIVNINTPNGSGVSHNTYIEFNVPTQGLILNNSEVETQTQTAGYIGGNRNVRNGSASLILNEVSGTNRSHLDGQMEVAGPSADVIVANPNGITVNGGSFINIPHATLTTGKVGFDNGRPTYEVEHGDILIEGKGLDATSTKELKLYTKALKLNAKLHGNSVDVVTGINDIDANGRVTVKDSSGKSRPAFSIDSTALGGIYANKIRLIGTQKGVGVNLPSEILAQESLQISSDGKIILGKVRVKNHASIQSHRGSIKINEGIHANSLDLEALTFIALYGNSGAETNVWLKSDTLYNYGLLASGVTEQFEELHSGLLHLGVATKIDNYGVLYGADGVILDTKVFVNNTQAELIGDNIEVNATQSLGNTGNIKADQVTIVTQSMQNSGLIYSESSSNVVSQSLDNTEGTITAKADNTLTVEQTLTNTKGTLYAGEDLTVTTKELSGAEGSIIAKGELRVTATEGMDVSRGYLEGNGTTLSTQTLTANEATLLSYETLSIDSTRMQADGSSIQAAGDVTIEATDTLSQSHDSLLYSGGDITVSAGTFDHSDNAVMQSVGDTRIQVNSMNHSDSTLLAEGVEISTQTLNNTRGAIQGTADVTVDTEALDNNQGLLKANQALTITATGDLDNTQGSLYSGSGTRVTSQGLNNANGFIGSAQAVSLDTTVLSGDNGTISGDGVEMHTVTVNANNATVQSTGSLDLIASGDVTLTESAVIANNGVHVTAKDTNLDGSTVASVNDALILKTEALTAEQAVLQAKGDLDLNSKGSQNLTKAELLGENIALHATGTVTTREGYVKADESLTIDAQNLDNAEGTLAGLQHTALTIDHTLTNTKGTLYAGEDLTVTTKELSGAEGSIIAKGELRVTATEGMDVSRGYLEGNGTTLSTQTLTANEATLLSYETLSIDSTRMQADGSSIQAAGDVTIEATDTLSQSHDSLLYSGGDITVSAGTFDHSDNAVMQSVGDTRIQVNSMNHSDSTLLAEGVEISTQTLNNTRGAIQGTADVTVDTEALDNNQGLLKANQALTITATGDLDNTQGSLYSGSGTRVTSQGLNNANGFIGSAQAVSLDTTVLSGDNGTISGDGVEMHTVTVNANNATVQSTGSLDLSASGDVTLTESAVIANNGVHVTAKDTNLDGSTLYSAHMGMTLHSTSLDATDSYMQAATTLKVEASEDIELSGSTLKGTEVILSTPQHLQAEGTDIVAGSTIEIQADSLEHTNGQFVAEGDLNVTVTHTLRQDQSLWIGYNSLNIHSQTHSIEGNSTLYGAKGIVLDSSERLEVTEDSRLITDGNLTVTTDALHLDNASLYAQQHAQITAAHITNRHSNSITSDNAVIQTRTLDNTDSNLTSAGGTLSIHTSDTLNNQHGLLSANGDLIINAQSLDTRNGDIEAGNTLDVTSHHMQIEDSRFFAGDRLAVISNISSIDAGTQFLSLNSMDLRFDGGLTNHGEITSNNIYGGETNITVQGDLNNEAHITVNGTLNIKTDNLNNNLHDTNASIKGSGYSTLTLTGNLNNAGFLTSRWDLNISAQNVTNTGGIAAGRDLTIESYTLHNYNTLFSSRDMNLYIRDLLSNHEDAVIYAGQDLTIAKNAAGDKTTRIENLAARIESGRDMNISAVTLENIGTVNIDYEIYYYNTITEQNMTRAEMEAWIAERDVDKGRGGISNSFVNDWLRANGLYDRVTELHGNEVNYGRDGRNPNTESWIEFITQVENRSSTTPTIINSGNNAFFNIDNVTNRNGNILATHNMVFNVINLDNTPSQVSIDINHTTHVFTWDFDAGWGSKRTDFWNTYAAPVTVDTTQVGGTSQILAGGTITGTIDTLNNGDIQEHATVDAPSWTEPLPDTETETTTADQVAHTSTDTTVTQDTTTTQNHTLTNATQDSVENHEGTLAEGQTVQTQDAQSFTVETQTQEGVENSGNTIAQGQTVQIQDTQSLTVETQTQEGVENSGNTIAQGQTVQTQDAQSLTVETQTQEGVENQEETLAQGQTVDTQTTEVAIAETPTAPETEPLPLAPTPIVYEPDPEQISLPDNPYGLYVTNPEPSGPLIETNPEYTDYGNYVSSQYMLDRLGYDGEVQTRRLGDAMYETQLIRDAIIALTGQRFIGGATDDTQQYQALMDSGVNYANGIQLELGVEPTPEQLKLLKEDIVWLVEREVQGQKVLVPVLYLAHQYDKPSGANIHANSMDLTVTNGLGNSGSLSTRSDMTLRAGSVTNARGEINAGGNMNIATVGDIKNLSGSIKGGSVVLSSREGDIVNQTLTKGIDVTHTVGSEHYTFTDKTATITATKGGMRLDAGHDIKNIGADLSSAGSMALVAGNDVTIQTIKDERSHDYQFGNGFIKGESITHTQSNIQADGLLDISAGNNANLEAVKIQADNTRITANNRVNLTAVVDSKLDQSHFTDSGFLSKSSRTDMTLTQSVKGTTIDTDTLIIEGKEGVGLESAQITAGNAASISSKRGDVDFTAASYTNASFHEETSSFLGGLFSSRSVDSLSETKLADSATKAQNQIVVKGENIALTATDLSTANGNIYLQAEDTVTIQAGMESKTEQHIREKSGLFQGGHLWQMKKDETATYDETAKASTLHAGAVPAGSAELKSPSPVHPTGRPVSGSNPEQWAAATKTAQASAEPEKEDQPTGSVIIDAGSAEVIGSTIQAADHILVDTDVGSITVTEAKEQHGRKELHEELNIDLTLGVKTGNGGVGITVASATYDKEALDEQSTSSASSTLQAGGTVQLTSVEDIKIQGSDITAGGDVTLDAQGDVSITEATDSMHSTTDETHIKAELSIGVQNEAAHAATAAKGLSDATKDLQRANRALSKYKEKLAQYKADYEAGIISPEDYQEAKDDLKYYQLNVAMAIKNEASAAKNAASAAQGLAASGMTGGFTGGVTLDVEGSQTHSTAEATSSTASHIVAGNDITIKTGQTQADGTRDTTGSSTTIQGSHLDAGNGITVDTGDLSITASRDTTRSNSSTKSMSASMTIGTGGITGGSIGGGFSKDRSKGTTYTNATLNANTLTLNTSGDASIRGANLHATEATTLNIGGDLEVASLQDRNSHNSVGIDASVGFSTDTDKQGTKTGQTTTASANYNSSNGNYIAVTNQTSITSDGKVNIDTKGNTHLAGALIEGEEATNITTATLTTEDIHNRADYNSMSVGATLTHSTSPDKAKDNGISPNIGLPQDVDKSSTTHTAIAENTVINITDKDKQTQDTDSISRDTEHASYTMTQINTEVLDIRAGISQDLSKDGFKAVGDLAMREGWEDGSAEKTLAHAAMGAVVAAVGNGDALGGALGAGAAEAARPATADADEGTQQTVSAIVGAIAGGGTGASTGRDGEEYNRQLHQREIALIKANAQAFADQHKDMNYEEALRILSSTALAGVDSEHANRFGVDAEAQAFLQDLAEQNGGVAFVADGDTRVQHMFNETDRSLYNNHAVNANELFTDGAREVYDAGYKDKHPNTNQSYYANTLANLATGSKDLANEGQEIYQQVVINAAELSNDTTLSDKQRDKLRNNSQEGVVHGMNYGAIDRDEVSITGDNELSRIWQGSLIDGQGAINMMIGGKAASVVLGKNGTSRVTIGGKTTMLSKAETKAILESNGKVNHNTGLHERINGKKPKANLPNGYKYNKDGNVITPEGQTLTKGTFTTPSGRTYDHYGREIDMDLKFEVKNHKTGVVKEYTNREWMSNGKGRNPYVLDSTGKPVPTNQHHNEQRASGPILELEAPKHTSDTKNLHPFGNEKNPYDPVNDRKSWDKDRESINNQRAEQLNTN